MNKFVTAFAEAVKNHSAMTGLSASEPATVHLWQILVSALEYADYHSIDFDAQLEDARQYVRENPDAGA